MNPAINAKKWARVRERVKERDGWACKQCGSMRATDVDHIKPIADGGELYALSNLQTLCRVCHREKTRSENIVSIPEQDRLYTILERVLTERV